MTSTPPFWRTTSLDAMTTTQWESLCDGCGRCCLHKMRDDVTDEIVWTNVSCRLLDTQTCQCSKYNQRHRYVPDCVSLTPDILREVDWLPPSCAYRLLRDGYDLPDWHPLISGTQDTVHAVGASTQGRCVNERHAGMLEDHEAEWPAERPDHAPPCIAPQRSDV